MTKVILTPADAVAPGASLEVVAEGKIFAVFNIDGDFHVLDGICPHAGGPLGKGTLRGGVVTCPWHGWQFDVPSGRHCLTQRICQSRFETFVEDGNIMIILP